MLHTSPSPADQSYDPIFFDSLFAIEDTHFWFSARNRIYGEL